MLFEPPPERPQTVGDLIGRGFRVYRRHVPLFFKTLLGPTIVSALGALGLQWALSHGIQSTSADNPVSIILLIAGVIVGLIVLMLAKWILTLRQLAFVRMADGFDSSYDSAYAILKQRKWSLLALFFVGAFSIVMLSIIWTVATLLLAVAIPKGSSNTVTAVVLGLGVSLGLLAFCLAIGLVFMIGFLVFCIIACEDNNLNTAITRGFKLVSADLYRTLSFAMVLSTVVWMISMPLSLPVVALTSTDLIQKGLSSERIADSYTMPLYIMVFSQAWESLVNMLVWPVVYLTFGFFYFDLRLRQEGLDITRGLEELEGKPA